MTYQLINRSAHDTGLPDESVDLICTSPPYFNLRSYSGDQAIDWPQVEYSPMPGLPPLVIPAMHCGLGEEQTPEAYIGHLVLVMREMWRVLKPHGTCWVNLSSTYSSEVRQSDLYYLRDDLTQTEREYVLSEIAKSQNDSAKNHD